MVDEVPLDKTMVRLGNEKIVVISGERTVESGTELLGSARMSNIVKELKHRYKDRIIIFDSPPVLFASDALVTAAWVDCVLFVVDYGKTSLKDVQKSLNGFPIDKVMGFVLNRGKLPKNNYYNYGYYTNNLK
jgi:non-specific protein-tyrosine kinase